GLRIECHQPRECANLCPDVADLSGDQFRGPQILRAVSRDAAQQKRNDSESWRCPACLREQTRKPRFVGVLPFPHPCSDMPTTRLKLSARRSETVSDVLAQLGGPAKRVVSQVRIKRDKVKKRLPRTQRREADG